MYRKGLLVSVQPTMIHLLSYPPIYEAWDEGFTLYVFTLAITPPLIFPSDVTNTNTNLIITLFATNETITKGQPVDNSEGKFLSQIVIPVTSLLNQQPIDQWFKLTTSSKMPNKEVTGEIHLKLQYTNITVHHLSV